MGVLRYPQRLFHPRRLGLESAAIPSFSPDTTIAGDGKDQLRVNAPVFLSPSLPLVAQHK